ALSRYLTARFPASTGVQASVEVVASDYHPLVLDNLRYNTEANFSYGTPSIVSLSACALDWSDYSPTAPSPAGPPFDEPFDLILGADVIYEHTHALWIRDCVAALLRRPIAGLNPRFHLVMPLRPTHAVESRDVQNVFLPEHGVSAGSQKFARMDWKLCVLEQETIVCEAEEGRGRAEVEYVHYVIGWV
ncbi:hypothetical protein K466DRAFT_592630, partial [Polyporus arcularius HHB13444]